MEDKDVQGHMQRSQFEELAEPLFEKIRNLLRRLIEQSGLRVEDIAEVELLGGSARIPLVKQIIANFFNREPKTTITWTRGWLVALECNALLFRHLSRSKSSMFGTPICSILSCVIPA